MIKYLIIVISNEMEIPICFNVQVPVFEETENGSPMSLAEQKATEYCKENDIKIHSITVLEENEIIQL